MKQRQYDRDREHDRWGSSQRNSGGEGTTRYGIVHEKSFIGRSLPLRLIPAGVLEERTQNLAPGLHECRRGTQIV